MAAHLEFIPPYWKDFDAKLEQTRSASPLLLQRCAARLSTKFRPPVHQNELPPTAGRVARTGGQPRSPEPRCSAAIVWGEIAGIAMGAAIVTVAFLGIAFFVFRWIRRRFFAPEAQPPPQILLPPPAPLLPPPPLPHVLQWLIQHGVNGGVQDMEAPPPPAPQPPPPPPLPMQLMPHGGHGEEPYPPRPPPPPMQLMPHEGNDGEDPYPPPPPLPPIHWIVQNVQVVHQPSHALPPNVLQWVLQHGGNGEESFESMNVQIGDVFDEEAESVASCSFTGGGGFWIGMGAEKELGV